MQVVIAHNTETRALRYAGRKLLGQADENEELLLFDVSAIDASVMKRYPEEIELYTDEVDLGNNTFQKILKIRCADTENVRIEREVALKNSLAADEYQKRNRVTKSFSAKTILDT